MKKLFALLAALLLTVTVSTAQTNTALKAGATTLRPAPVAVEKNGWSISLGGTGLTAGDNIGNDWQWGGELGLSKQIPLSEKVWSDLGVRQTISYGTVGYENWSRTETAPCTLGEVTTTGTSKKDGWMFRTEVFYDLNLPIYKTFTFFVGPNFGCWYGNISPQWTVGPEAGFKVGLGKNWELFTRANYDWVVAGGSQDGFRVTSGFIKSF